MATRAVYSFTGFSDPLHEQPTRHFYLDHDGYPAGAAWRFITSLRHSGVAEGLLAAFRHTQPEAIELATLAEAADADYRYALRLWDGRHPSITVKCWRRHPATSSWHRRCGPLPLEAFIQRFAPGELAKTSELSGAGPDDVTPENPPARD